MTKKIVCLETDFEAPIESINCSLVFNILGVKMEMISGLGGRWIQRQRLR
jgi:hypothetical protein